MQSDALLFITRKWLNAFCQILKEDPRLPPRWSDEVQILLKNVLLSKNPSNRCLVSQVKRSKWWSDINWRQLFFRQTPPPMTTSDPMDVMMLGFAYDDDDDDVDDEDCVYEDDGEECFS